MTNPSEVLRAVSPSAGTEELEKAIERSPSTTDISNQLDSHERTALHILAAAGKDDSVDLCLQKSGSDAARLVSLQDGCGNTALHVASSPMICYQLAAADPSACLVRNAAGDTPIDLAAAKQGSGEALNALLLACSGSSTPEALEAMTLLTQRGAVPDTWAPNGQSSLMLAAAADSREGIVLLLAAGASMELQDALGRTALMWAAGCGASKALQVLLEAGASVAQRDRRGRTATDYAEAAEVKVVLEKHVKYLEVRAAAAQEALMAELMADEERKAASKASKRAKKKAAREKKKAGGGGSSIREETQQQQQLSSKAATKSKSSGSGNVEAEARRASPAAVLPLSTPPAAALLSEPRDTSKSAAATAAAVTPDLPPPLGANINRPMSPDWLTVCSKPLKQGFKPAITAARAPPALTAAATTTPANHYHSRSASNGSVASASSGASSQETNGSKQSGSERSVLRRGPAMGAAASGQLPSGIGSGAPLLPRPPAPQQKQAFALRSGASSGGEEVVQSVPAASARKGGASWASVAAQGGATSTKSLSPPPPSTTATSSAGASPAPSHPPSTSATATEASTSTVSTPPHEMQRQEDAAAAKEEIAALRAEVQRLRMTGVVASLAHQQELAAVLQDAARHEAAAVAQASADERTACIIRFASMLQNNEAALASVLPSLLAGAGVPGVSAAAADELMASFSNNSRGDPQAEALAAMGLPEADDSRAARGSSVPIGFGRAVAPEVPPSSSTLFGESPLSTSPFSFEVGEHLRGEFLGNHSAFMVPASETELSPARGGVAGSSSWLTR